MYKLFFLSLCLAIAFPCLSQKTKQERKEENRKRINLLAKKEEEGIIVFKQQLAIGGKLTSDGYGIFFELGKARSVKNASLFQLEFAEHKHVKEEKQSNLFNLSTPYIFGKQNFFYPVKLGMQQQMLFGNKSNKNGVSITGNYGGGLIAGLLRPYYVQLSTTGDYIKYQDSDSAAFLDPQIISGGPGFSKGWSEIKVTPGLYAKAAIRFDYGSFNEVLSAVEVGITGEFYSKKIPILVRTEPKQFFFTGYLAIIIGKRK